jgi:hypothetical protein
MSKVGASQIDWRTEAKHDHTPMTRHKHWMFQQGMQDQFDTLEDSIDSMIDDLTKMLADNNLANDKRHDDLTKTLTDNNLTNDKQYDDLMSTHASVLVDSVGPASAEVCRAAASFP